MIAPRFATISEGTMSIRVETAERVTTVILDRPEVRNAVDGPSARALEQAFLAFDRDAAADVAVLWGAHGTFCSGADLKALAAAASDPERSNPLIEDVMRTGPMGPSRLRLSKPVIAAIAGHAVAGGLELALWCDLRVVEETATLGVFCRRFGVPLIDGGTIRLPRLIGMSRALDLILTGRAVDAQEAHAMGLANRVVPHGDSRRAAEALAREIARFPQGCMRSDRRSAYEQWDEPMASALAREFALGMATIRSGETVAGAQAFADGRGRHGAFG
jgi:enoyl-CoA hydratase